MESEPTTESTITRGEGDRQNAISGHVYCPQCAYDLHGAVSDRCSECGYSLENIRSPICRIPWVRRRESGWMRAYWRTVWMVVFRPRRFCEEAARPVSYTDAQSFRWVTVLHAYLPVLFAAALAYMLNPPEVPSRPDFLEIMQKMAFTGSMPPGPSFAERAYAELWPVLILLAGLFLFLAAATGLPSYFFQSRRLSPALQHRVVALSYYCCAPLAFTALPVLIIIGTIAFPPVVPQFLALGAFWALLLWLAWLILLARLARRTVPCLPSRAVLISIALPLSWLALAGLTLIALPAVILYVLIVFYSLA